ncbi:UNVERIFIED_CONTAM: hypothetical protein PYX00_008440 [Menopon gallinae]|uniref:Large ribosomal subunit protein mL52 n=1 Tax=Menopon gallinae TaxID=328185 RepID=A0AAW2HNJ7_9NEOP
MALLMGRSIRVLGYGIATGQKSFISTSGSCMIKWRYEQDIEPNPNRYGPLTQKPDYSFVDGRPVPIGVKAYKRMKLQEKLCERIVTLSGEIDFAIDRYNKKKEEEEMFKKHMIESKLKSKGDKLQ